MFQDELDLQANANFVQGSGARAFGMGGAFLARADDATAASWNPAGLSYLKAPEVSLVFARFRFEGRKSSEGIDRVPRLPGATQVFEYARDTRDDRSGGFPDFMAFAWPWEAGDTSGAIQISFQRVIPFTTSRTITDEFTGTLTNTTTQEAGPRTVFTSQTVESAGGFDVLALGTGLRLSRHVRMGMTVNRWFHGYEQTVRKLDLTVPSRQHSEFDVSGWNLHVGTILSPSDSLNLGLVLKTGFTAPVRLRRTRTDTFPGGVTVLNSYSRDDLQLRQPGAFGVGLSWRSRSNLTLSMDYTQTRWSETRIRQFFALPAGNPAKPPGTQGPSPLETGDFCGEDPDELPRFDNVCPPELPYPTLDTRSRQPDTEQLRAGIEYVIIKNRLKWPLRAGYFRDGQFFRSREGDAPTFDGLTLGTGLILRRVLLDLAYAYEWGSYTDANLEEETLGGVLVHFQAPAENRIKSHKFYASVIYRFSRRP